MGTAKKRQHPPHGTRRETADFDWEQFISASTGKAGTGISCGELGDRLARQCLDQFARSVRNEM